VPEFLIGKMSIPYELVENARLKRMRLTIAPEAVRVQGPQGITDEAAQNLLRANEAWLFEKWRDIQENPPFNPWPERFVPGAKVFWNGRWEKILETKIVPEAVGVCISYDKGFILSVPSGGNSRAEIEREFLRFFGDSSNN
jgi:hypothetical protein